MRETVQISRIVKKLYYKIFIENFNKKIIYDFPIDYYRWDLIKYLHEKYKFNTYLEIGCDMDQLFSKINIKKKFGVDPFSGVITTGWGKPPGASTEYRATVYIQDPSLDARALKVVLLKRSGPADSKTIKTIENAILSRARQLRISDDKL